MFFNPTRQVSQIDDRGHCYVFLDKSEVEASDTVIMDTFLICDPIATVLFGLSSTYSYICIKFTLGLAIIYDIIYSLMYVFLL